MKITGVEVIGHDTAVNIEGQCDVLMPNEAYKLLNEHRADLKAYIESLPTVEVAYNVDDVPDGAEMHYLSVAHPECGHIWVFFYLQGDSVVVTADYTAVPYDLFSRTTDLEGLVQIIEAAVAELAK
ncbi:hypothetical protein MQM1_059 [Aeromonas phage vB_AsaP_MQM1]|nr:hypothetical protein MQM1_059 [Aeromonas phage vB_AsaP_MQM1]